MNGRSDPSAGAPGAAGLDLDEGDREGDRSVPPSGAPTHGAPPTGRPVTAAAADAADAADDAAGTAPPGSAPIGTAPAEPGLAPTGTEAAGGAGPGAGSATPAEEDLVVIPDVMPADAGAVAAERDEYLAALQRLKADFENFRKRVLRQQEEQADRAALDLVSKLLPVLDTLDLAEAHIGAEPGEDAAAHAVLALGQARAQLNDVLVKEGLQRVDRADVTFDPAVHDAVAHAPATESDPGATMIDEVLRSGYRWRGQVLRPAMVRVRG